MAGKNVLKKNYRRGFTTIGNEIFFDKELRNSDVGLLVRMFSFPDDWKFSIEGLAEICADGVDAIRSSIQRLEKFGYLKRSRLRDENGKLISSIYDFYDYRHFQDDDENDDCIVDDCEENENTYNTGETQKDTSSEPMRENPTLDNPASENRRQYNKKNKINKIKKENNIYSIKEKTRSESLEQNTRSEDVLPVQDGYNFEDSENSESSLSSLQNQDLNSQSKIKTNNDKSPNIPELEEVKRYVVERDFCVDPYYFFDYYDSLGWHNKNGKPVLNWKNLLITWNQREKERLEDKAKSEARTLDLARQRDLKKADDLEKMAYLLCDTPEEEEELRKEIAMLRGEDFVSSVGSEKS